MTEKQLEDFGRKPGHGQEAVELSVDRRSVAPDPRFFT
jgi:hypothetical protein